MNKILCMVTVVLAGLFGNLIVLAADSPGDFHQALELLSRPGLSPERKSEALGLLDRVAVDYESRADNDYRLWYEAGNARWWGQKAALAILDYRHYLARDPFRVEVWENLTQARTKAGTQAPGGEGLGEWPWLVWLLHASSLLVGLSVLTAGVWCLVRKAIWLKLAIVLISMALACGLGLVVVQLIPSHLGVILADTQGRKGDAEVYAAQPGQPWKAGQEAWITEIRGNWVRLEIAGTVSWVPLSAVEVIDRPTP